MSFEELRNYNMSVLQDRFKSMTHAETLQQAKRITGRTNICRSNSKFGILMSIAVHYAENGEKL